MIKVNLMAFKSYVFALLVALTSPVMAYDVETSSQNNIAYVLLVNDNPGAVFHSIAISQSLPSFVTSANVSIVPDTVLGGGASLAAVEFDVFYAPQGTVENLVLTVSGQAAGADLTFDVSIPLEIAASAAAVQGQYGSTIPAPDPGGVDTDGDGISDALEVAFGSNPQLAGSTPSNPGDADSDGISDSLDNCPSIANADQADADNDGAGDVCDSTPNGDTDADGVDNLSDNCPTDANADQTDSDSDGAGDACDATPNGDTDSDTIDNAIDNCPTDANTDQADADNDGLGDVCDPSPNGNEVAEEYVPMLPSIGFGLLSILLAAVSLNANRKRLNK